MSILRWSTKEAWESYESASNIDTTSYPGYLCNLSMSDYFDGEDINQNKWAVQSINMAYTCSNGLFLSPIDNSALFQLQTSYLIPQMFDINIKIENYSNSYLYIGIKKDSSNKVEIVIDHNNISLYNNGELLSEQSVDSSFSLILTRYSKKIAIILKIDNILTELGSIIPTFWDASLYVKFQPHNEDEVLTIKHIEITGYNTGFSYEIGEGRYLSNGVVDDNFDDSFLDIKWQTSNTGIVTETNSGIILRDGGYIYQMLDYLEIPRYTFNHWIHFNAINDFEFYCVFVTETTPKAYTGFRIVYQDGILKFYTMPLGSTTYDWIEKYSGIHVINDNINIYIDSNYVYLYIGAAYIYNTSFTNIATYIPHSILFKNISQIPTVIYNFHVYPSIYRNGTLTFDDYNSQIWEFSNDDIPISDITFLDDKIILIDENRSSYDRGNNKIQLTDSMFTGTKWDCPIGITGTSVHLNLSGDYYSSSYIHTAYYWRLEGTSTSYPKGFFIKIYRSTATNRRIDVTMYYRGAASTSISYYLENSCDDFYILTQIGVNPTGSQYPYFLTVEFRDNNDQIMNDRNNNPMSWTRTDVDDVLSSFRLDEISFRVYCQSANKYNKLEINNLIISSNYTMQFDDVPYSGSFITIEPQNRGDIFLPSTAIYKFKSYTVPTKFSSVYTKSVDDLFYILFSNDGNIWYGPYGKYEDSTDNFYTSSSEIFYLPKSETDEYYYAVHMVPAEYSDSIFFTSFSKYLSLALKLNNNIDFSKYMRTNEQTPIQVAQSKYFRLKTPLELYVNYSAYNRENLYFEITTSDKYLWLNNVELEDDVMRIYTINKGNADIVGIYGDFIGTLIATVGNIDYLVSPNCFFMMETIDANEIKLTAIGKLTINHLGVYAIWD